MTKEVKAQREGRKTLVRNWWEPVSSLLRNKEQQTALCICPTFGTNQVSEVWISEQVWHGSSAYAEVFLSPGVSSAIPPETSCHWTARLLLPTLPPVSLVFCQPQSCPLWLDILCCWKLLTALKHELESHASKLSRHSSGRASPQTGQTVPKVACETPQGPSSTSESGQQNQIKGNENMLAEPDTYYKGLGVPAQLVNFINRYFSLL